MDCLPPLDDFENSQETENSVKNQIEQEDSEDEVEVPLPPSHEEELEVLQSPKTPKHKVSKIFIEPKKKRTKPKKDEQVPTENVEKPTKDTIPKKEETKLKHPRREEWTARESLPDDDPDKILKYCKDGRPYTKRMQDALLAGRKKAREAVKEKGIRSRETKIIKKQIKTKKKDIA